jgi:hypothetical protein
VTSKDVTSERATRLSERGYRACAPVSVTIGVLAFDYYGNSKMRNGSWFIAITFLLLSGTFAFADDKSECLDGIKAIKTAIAKKPPKPVLDRLKRALDGAEQEEFEGDWDECVAAVRQAKLPKK